VTQATGHGGDRADDGRAPTTDEARRLGRTLATSSKAAPEDARRANRSLLLRALHHGGAASRADLAKLVGLTPATVSAVVKDLIAEGLVEELGRTTARQVGKPATMIGLVADGRHVVTLGLSERDQFVGAIVDLGGKVIERRTYPRHDRTGDAAVAFVGEICDDLLGDTTRPVLGVGVASPGIVAADGTVVTAAHLGWHGVPLGPDLAARTGLPVHVANDANAAALAELTFGTGDSANLILVRVDEGVGAGLVLGGALFTGSRSAAGEIGHVVVDPDGAPCACGKRGCLETAVSAPLLGQRLDEAGGDGVDVLRAAGEALGTALATVVSALDVIDVVLSGPAPVATETFRGATVNAVAARTMPEISDRLVVRPSSFGGDDVLLGAAALVLDRELGLR
jgi:predicted NBD/HSP70 family sugar kinase